MRKAVATPPDQKTKRVDLTSRQIKNRKKIRELGLKTKKPEYISRRLQEYPAVGDQLDVAYKDRVARQLAAGKARKALEDGDKDKALEILIDAIDAGADADGVDGRITAVKSAIKKPKV